MKTPIEQESLHDQIGYYAGEHLPKTVRYVDRAGNPIERVLPEATLDEVAFAIRDLSEESRVLIRRLRALEYLYTMAREVSCVGALTVLNAVQEVAK